MKVKEITLKENYKVIKNDPQAGLELVDQNNVKMIIPPEQALAFQADPQDPKKFTMNPEVLSAPAQPQQPQGPQVGAEVELPTSDVAATETFDNDDLIGSGKNKPIGGKDGDKTDSLIRQVLDPDYEDTARSMRNVKNTLPVHESEDLIAVLTIAGLR